MQARMKNPAMVVPGAMDAFLSLNKLSENGPVAHSTLELAHLRASQINGCSLCVDYGARTAKQAGESDERLFAVAAWRESPHFNDAERAALALAESMTRLADQSDPVPDAVWDEAARHFEEPALAVLVIHISLTNLFNRLNAATRQVAGSWR